MAEIGFETMMQIAKLGPLPTLERGPDYDAVFEPFHCDGVEYFRYYDASTMVWLIGKTVDVDKRLVIELSDDDAESPEEIRVLNDLAFLPPPRLPSEFQGPMFRGPFWYRHLQFVWFLLDVGQGWQLAISRPGPVQGKRDAARTEGC